MSIFPIEELGDKRRAELAEKGGTIWIRRRGKCKDCGRWVGEFVGRAHPTPDMGRTCCGAPRGRRRYSAWVSIVGAATWYPAGLFPRISDLVAAQVERARAEQEDWVVEVNPEDHGSASVRVSGPT